MNKAHIIILVLFLFNHHFLNAQENDTLTKYGKIGITFSSFGENDVVSFPGLDGGASYNGNYFYTLGITYVYPINTWLEFESGFEYAKHYITIKPNLPPDMDDSPRKENFGLANIPVTLRANFLNYFFFNGGFIIDIGGLNSPIDDQTGIGALLGISAKYDFPIGVSAFVNPYIKVHSIFPFQSDTNHYRILESGIRMGLTYKLPFKTKASPDK